MPLIINVPLLNVPVTPAGKPLAVAPVADPETEYCILVIGVFAHTVCVVLPEVRVIVCNCTVILPDILYVAHVPVVVTVNGKVPATVGVPLIVNVVAVDDVDTPAGREPLVIDAPVVVPPKVYVMLTGELIHTVGNELPDVRLSVCV